MQADIGKLVLRLTLGVLILFHGVHKLIHGVGFIENMMVAHHLPAFFAWAVYIGEVLAPLMIILGVKTRIGGGLIVANMVVAFLLVDVHRFFTLASSGGWALEVQAFYLFTALSLVFLGPGRFRLHS